MKNSQMVRVEVMLFGERVLVPVKRRHDSLALTYLDGQVFGQMLSLRVAFGDVSVRFADRGIAGGARPDYEIVKNREGVYSLEKLRHSKKK